jgi:acetyl-CoA synthetase
MRSAVAGTSTYARGSRDPSELGESSRNGHGAGSTSSGAGGPRDQEGKTVPELVTKDPASWRVTPHLRDYAAERARFRWEDAVAAMAGLSGGRGLNIAHEAVDRHAGGPHGQRVALRWLPRHGAPRDLRYAELREHTNRFANLLGSLGVEPEGRVFALLPRIPALYVTALGALKARAVFCPLFSAFGPEPVRERLALGRGRVLVTTERHYRRKIQTLRPALPALEHVLLTGRESAGPPPDGTRDLDEALAAASPEFEIPATAPEDPALLHFTSGTTGAPKGAQHVHGAVVAHHATARFALDFHEGDIFWCTADPGWVTGTSYGIVAPLSHGLTSIIDEGDFDPERWYTVLQDQRVSLWYTAPTALRMLMKAGPELARKFDLSALRFVASVGEPLNAEAVLWGRDASDQASAP